MTTGRPPYMVAEPAEILSTHQSHLPGSGGTAINPFSLLMALVSTCRTRSAEMPYSSAELVQRRLVVRHPAPLQYAAAALVELLERDAQPLAGILFPLLALDLDRRIRIARRQVHRRG